jgi:hypothetical protein
MKYRSNQRGNVLFLILIAVALFAALSYAVTQSSRSGGDSARETNILNSAQLAQYPNQIRTAVLRQNIDGVDITAVRFNAPADFATLDNNRIGVFHPEGGGAVYQQAPGDMMANGNPGTWIYNMDFEVTEIGITGGAGAIGNELIGFLDGVTLSVCQRINVEAGVRANISDAPPVTLDLSATYALNMVDVGGTDYAITGNVDLDGATTDAGTLHGQPFGCFRNTATGNYVYYHVISER